MVTPGTPALSRRVADIEESPTLAVTAKANALRAAGEPVIGFGAGEPDFATPAHVVEAAAAACSEPANHRYSPAAGWPRLREAVAAKTERDSGLQATAGMVTVTNGGKHALFNVFQALVEPGDEVILPAPYWVSYPEQIRLAGGVVRTVETDEAGGFRATLEQLEAARTDATKALLFVSPSNPTGAVYPPEQVARIGRWAAEHGLWVVADEIYEHLVYGEAEHASLPVAAPAAAERTVVVNGVSKAYAMTGWRLGWSVAPEEVASALARLQSHATSNVNNVAQAAALAALEGPQDGLATMREAFDRRRRIAVERLRAIPGVSCAEPHGAFYVFPSFADWIGRTVAGTAIDSTLTLAQVLLEEAKVALVPGEAFGAPGHVRLSYALGDDDLAEGLERIADLLEAGGR